MNRWKGARCGFIAATNVAFVVLAAAAAASAQHVTPAMAVAIMGTRGPDATGCEDRARQAAKTLDALNANLERARLANSESAMREAVDALQKGFTDLTARLGACRVGAAPPASAAVPPAAATPQTPATPQPAATPAARPMAGMDHSTMNMSPAGAAAAPTTVRQITGPAEAALQAFEDALQVGNRDVALEWLAPEATITEAGATDASRDAYANEHMGVDMAFLKTARIALLERQAHPGVDSTHIVSTTRVTGRAGEMPVDVMVSEAAVVRKTPRGWRIVTLAWTLSPVKPDTP